MMETLSIILVVSQGKVLSKYPTMQHGIPCIGISSHVAILVGRFLNRLIGSIVRGVGDSIVMAGHATETVRTVLVDYRTDSV